MRKFEIINALIAKNRYSKYLEICTPTTGLRFSRIDQSHLRWRHRLLYRCPVSHWDGSEITFRSETFAIEHLLKKKAAYDLIFVDPYHSLDCSLRDLQFALELLRPGGTIVVHDCCPVEKSVCTPEFQTGSWFGVTYCAYVDFVLSHTALTYYTVDTDCGCGVIKKPLAESAERASFIEEQSELADHWFSRRRREDDMFEFFRQHHRKLLKLISVKEFLGKEEIVLPVFSHWRESIATALGL